MFKALGVLVVLVIGFGVGVYWGVHHPMEAANLSDQEEKWVLKGKVEATDAITQKLNGILNKPAASPVPGSGFLGGSSSASSTADALRQLRDESQQQLSSMQTQLAQKK